MNETHKWQVWGTSETQEWKLEANYHKVVRKHYKCQHTYNHACSSAGQAVDTLHSTSNGCINYALSHKNDSLS